jgi:hypothetical protein
MMRGKCKRCSGVLIEIDDQGTQLRGCLACNDWHSTDGLRRVKLAEEDVEALRSMRGQSGPSSIEPTRVGK